MGTLLYLVSSTFSFTLSSVRDITIFFDFFSDNTY